jgi:hypothetical protein
MTLPVVGEAHQAGAGQDFVWFVYGSALDHESFFAWARGHGYEPPDLSAGRPARLEGFRLSFDVVSRNWGGAVASVVESRGEFVEGIAVPMPGSARGMVEHREGALSGLYRAFDVKIVPARGGPELAAVAFRAAPGRRLPTEGAPSAAYRAALLRGARAFGLSESWIERLERLEGR